MIDQLTVFHLVLVPYFQPPAHWNRLLGDFAVSMLGHSQIGAGPPQPALVDAASE